MPLWGYNDVQFIILKRTENRDDTDHFQKWTYLEPQKNKIFVLYKNISIASAYIGKHSYIISY